MRIINRLMKALFPLLAALTVWTASAMLPGKNPREKMWLPEIERFVAQDSVDFPGVGKILFVGSSSIRTWKNIEQYFPGYDIVRRGVGGSHLEDIIYFSDRIVFPYKPRQIVLYEGDNDLKDGFTPERFLDDVKTFVRLVELHSPGTEIILLSVKPSPSRRHVEEKYLKANELMEAYAAGKEHVKYLDITAPLKDGDRYRADMFHGDSLHVTPKAFREWARIITPHLIPGPGSVSKLSTPESTPQTEALYAGLNRMVGNKTMFGHQDDTAYGVEWEETPGGSDVRAVCGDYPAVYGWEIGGIEHRRSENLDKVNFKQMKRLIREAYDRGGINTISWHADNLVTGGNTWDLTGGNVVATLLPGGEHHAEFCRWLDRVAEFLASLKGSDGESIPVIFRPLHEHTGSWFWWGRDFCSVDEYVALWRQIVTYLRDVKGLKIVIYCYSPDRVRTEAEYLERYPGGEYVDLLGLDLYHFKGEEGLDEYRTCADRSLNVLQRVACREGKPFAFTETGLESITMDNWFSEVLYPLVAKYKPAYVLVWRNSSRIENHFYAPYPGHASAADFVKFKEKPSILFNGDLQHMYENQ